MSCLKISTKKTLNLQSKPISRVPANQNAVFSGTYSLRTFQKKKHGHAITYVRCLRTCGLPELSQILLSLWFFYLTSTMGSRICIGSHRRKYVLVVAILLIVILYQSMPARKSKLDLRTDVSHAENRPQYLHQSTFRVDPDYKYESKLSNALRDIEIAGNRRHDEDKTDTIWQIILSTKDHRKDDSYQFEKTNPEWKYQVRYLGRYLSSFLMLDQHTATDSFL